MAYSRYNLSNYKTMIRVVFLSIVIFFVKSMAAQTNSPLPVTDRKLWLGYLDKIARPVLVNLAGNTLKENMPVVLSEKVDNKKARTEAAYLEAFGRTLCGIAPWLQLQECDAEEKKLQNEFRQLASQALTNAVNPTAKDFLLFTGTQSLVDASFLSLALIRCPWLWQQADAATKHNLQAAFLSTRNTVPYYSNWLLFSAMIETFFCRYQLPYDKMRIDYAVKEFASHWYTGDGMFSDGMQFHLDYYNSYVIQPYLQCIVDVVNKKDSSYQALAPTLQKIARRYAVVQERMINTDGSFPVTGRSITYRGGAFHHLANMAYNKQLPAELSPAQIRCALTAVIKKTLDAPATFTEKGWLNIGLCGSQPGLAEGYINTGSEYLCTQIFLPLGLPATDNFWNTPAVPWTSVKIWSGQDVPADHAVE
ncbi:DUF2264 domain-containing protein [Ferruginibacter paludis]|uniref:DUF2264 domain-containing protein n=1 Tax=Ferruginibacter paludis TaxID=1310417 RepID=UPI0025B2CD70|nr:DUF2264 domain-containing protein [Ferruginibacter paludis]MDN3655529.1 DUF2264 domain-containing protein [Ferruginibacter paludis]